MTRFLEDPPFRIGGDTPEIGSEVSDRYEARAVRESAPWFFRAGLVAGYVAAWILYAVVVCLIAGALWGVLQVGVLAWDALP